MFMHDQRARSPSACDVLCLCSCASVDLHVHVVSLHARSVESWSHLGLVSFTSSTVYFAVHTNIAFVSDEDVHVPGLGGTFTL